MEYSETLYLWVNVPTPEEFGRKLFAWETWQLKLVCVDRLGNGDYIFREEPSFELIGKDLSLYPMGMDDKLPYEVSFTISGGDLKEFDGVALDGNGNLHMSFAMNDAMGVVMSAGFYDFGAKEFVGGREYRWPYDEGMDEDEALERRNFLEMLERAKKLK